MPAQVLKNNCTSGELSPKLHRRSDIQQYQNGLAGSLNAIVSQYGGVYRRFGTKYIVSSKHSDKLAILKKFEFSVTQAYMIEFGEYYIRFYRNKAQIVVAYSAWATATDYVEGDLVTYSGSYYRCIDSHTSGTFAVDLAGDKWEATAGATDLAYEIPTDYSEADLRELRFEPSTDVLYIFHGDYHQAKLTRTDHTEWTWTDYNNTGGPFLPDNTTDDTLTPGRTTNPTSANFYGLSQTTRAWSAMCATVDGDVYACVDGGDIYKQTGGVGDFVALGQTSRAWSGMCATLDGNVYACVLAGGIYMQTAGTGDFNDLSQTSRAWYGMCATAAGNVYACVGAGDIYMQTAGAGDFNALSQTSRSWRGMAAAPNGDVYCCVISGDIYVQTAGAGNFVGLSETARLWNEMCAAPNGDIYACCRSAGTPGDIYKQTASTGSFVALDQTLRYWDGMAALPSGEIYASVDNGDIYRDGGAWVKITASSAIFEDGHIGSLWKLSSGVAVAEITADMTANGNSSVVETASETVEIEISGTWDATVTIQRSFNKGTDWYKYMTIGENCVKQLTDTRDIQYRITVADYASGTISVRLSVLDANATGQGTFIVKYVAPSGLYCLADVVDEIRSTDATTIWAEAAWSGVLGYPREGKIAEGRLMMMCTDYDVRGVWGSSSLDYENMLAGTNDDDAFYFSYDAKGGVSVVKWALSWKHLAIGTYGGEIRLISSGGMTPSNPPDKKQDSDYGSAEIPAFVAGKSVIFVDRSGRILREYIYDDSADAYDSDSLSTLSEHLLNNGGGIVDITYQQKQNSLIWCVLNDGTMAVLTYLPAQQVIGWSPMELGGTAEVEAIEVMPGDYGHDEVWMTVKRTINGSVVRYVEILEEDDTNWSSTVPVWQVDCGAVYDGSPATTITGLSYLEGESVAVLADNISVGRKTVTGGQITLDTAASYVIVGIPFTTRIKTLKPDAGSPAGTALGRKLRVTKPVAHFVDTGNGIQYGPDTTRLKDVPDLEDGELKTIDVSLTMPGGFDTDGEIVIETDEPVPMYLASLTYDVAPGE